MAFAIAIRPDLASSLNNLSASLADLASWTALVERIKRPKPEVRIALDEKELPYELISVPFSKALVASVGIDPEKELKILAVGVCHTDVNYFLGAPPVTTPTAKLTAKMRVQKRAARS